MKLGHILARSISATALAFFLVPLLSNCPAFAKQINVKNYGAKGDGKTDDTAAIKKAIATGVAGDTVYFPAGNYLHSTYLLFNSLSVLGDGAAKSLLTASSRTNGALEFTGKNVRISAVCVQYSSPSDSIAYLANGIYLQNIAGFTISGTTVRQTSANGISINLASNGLITSSTISSPTETGVYIQRSSNISVSSNTFPLTSTAVYVNNTHATTAQQNITIASNRILNSSGYTGTPAIYVVGVKFCKINTNNIANNFFGGILVQGNNLLNLGPSSNVTVHGNTVTNCNLLGSIYVDGSSDGSGTSQQTVSNVTITSNTLTNNPSMGILILGEYAKNVSGVVVNANIVRNVPTAPGIWVDNTVNATIGDAVKTDGNTVDSTGMGSIYLGPGNSGKLVCDSNLLSNAGPNGYFVYPAHNAVLDLEGTTSGGTNLTSVDIENNSYTGTVAGLDDFIFDGAPKHLLTSDVVQGNTTTTMLPTVVTP